MPVSGAFNPRWLTPVSQKQIDAGDGEFAIDFIQSFCRVTKDSVAANTGELLILRDWQQELVKHLLARRDDGRLKHKEALILMPRKSGKSALLSSLTLYLTYTGPNGGETYAVASSKDQARIVFNDAKKMIQMDPELSAGVKLYRDAIEIVSTGSVMRVLAAEAPQLEGLNVSAVCVDEVHTLPNRELWDVLALARASRLDAIQIGISTAGVKSDSSGKDSLCYGMYNYGKQVAQGLTDDADFFMAAWEPQDPNADHTDESVWAEANPGINDISSLDDFRSSVKRTPAAEFKTKRLNMWVNTMNTWIDSKDWDANAIEYVVPDGTPCVLGFDGSFSGDASALVLVTIADANDPESKPHVECLNVWEKPTGANDDWRVSIEAVESAIIAAAKKYDCREIVCDPYRYGRTYQVLETEYRLNMVEFPQSPARMIPATQVLTEAIQQNTMTHSGNKDLARHISNAHIKTDARGSRLSKESKNSNRKIDLAVATVMAFSRAQWLSNVKPASVQFYDFDEL